MGRLTKEEVAQINSPSSRPRGGGGVPGALWRGYERAARLAGLAVGTAAGAVGEIIPGLNRWTPDVYSSTPEAFRAFWEQAGRGDWDAAIAAYQDEMGAGKGYWGAAEAVGGILPTGGPAFAGTRLLSAAPKLAGTLGLGGTRAAPRIERGVRWLGKGLRAPWEAEEAVARGVMKGAGLAARTVRHPMTGPLAPARIARVAPLREAERRGRPRGARPVTPTPPVTPVAPVIAAAAPLSRAAILHQLVMNSPVRKNGIVASSEAQVKAYFNNLRSFVKEVGGDNAAILRIIDNGEDAWLSGDIRKAVIDAEYAYSQGHMLAGANFPDEDYFVRSNLQLAEDIVDIDLGQIPPTAPPTLKRSGPAFARAAPPAAAPIPARPAVVLGAAKLPRELAGAKPNYNMGPLKYAPQFESDVDKSLFIISQTKKSPHDEEYMVWLRGQLPNLSDAQLRAAGRDVRAHIKATVTGQPEGAVVIPLSSTVRELGVRLAPPAAPPVTPAAARGVAPAARVADEFEARFRRLSDIVRKEEKTPERRMSQEEVDLWERDWKAYSRSRGYTEAEIADSQKLIDAFHEGKRLGYTDDELWSIGEQGRIDALILKRAAPPTAPPVTPAAVGAGFVFRTKPPKRGMKTPKTVDEAEEQVDEVNDYIEGLEERLGDMENPDTQAGTRLQERIDEAEQYKDELDQFMDEAGLPVDVDETIFPPTPVTPIARAAPPTAPPVTPAAAPQPEAPSIGMPTPRAGVGARVVAPGAPTPAAVPPGGRPPRIPPTGRPQPGGPGRRGRPPKGDIPDLQPIEEVIEVATQENVGRSLARRIAGVPLIGHIMRQLNPTVITDTLEARAIVGRNILRFEADQKSEQAMTELNALGNQEQLFGKLNELGRFAEGRLKGMAPNNVRTASKTPEIRKLLTPAQRDWMDTAQRLEAAKLALFTRNGIDINLLTFAEGGKLEYAGRRVLGKYVNGVFMEATMVGQRVGRRIGTVGKKSAQERERRFPTIKEAEDAGFRYMDEDEALAINLQAAYRRVADKKFAEYVIENSKHLRKIKTKYGRPKAFEISAYKKLLGNSDFTRAYFKVDTPEGQKAAELILNELTSVMPELRVLSATAKVNALVRFMELNADMGQFMIQLLYLGGSRPKVWGKAINGFVKAWTDVAAGRNVYHSQLIDSNRDLLYRHPGLLTTIKGSEYTEAAEQGGLLLKIPGIGKAVTWALNPFARAFNAAMDTAGIELAKSLDSTLRPKTVKEFADIDAFINEIRGLASSARMGVSPTMRAVENNLLLAPRYNRAIAALLWDTAADGGLRGQLAREALARSVAGLVALGSAFKMAEYMNKTDQKDWTIEAMTAHVVKGINPTSPEFFTWEIGGSNIGPGTKVRSIVKLYADSLQDPDSLLELSNRNPFIRFARGTAAPVLSDTWDMFSGHNYIGEPTGWRDGWDEGVIDNLKKAGQRVFLPDIIPIWAHAALLESGGLGQRAARGAVEFFGGRAYPLRRAQLAQGIATQQGLGDYETLDARPKSLVDKLVTEQYGEDAYSGADGPKLQQKDDADTDLLADTKSIAEKYLAAPISSAEFAPKLARLAYNDARNMHRGYLYGVKWDEEKQRTVGGLLEQLYDMDQEREEPEEGTRDHRLWQYGQTFNEAIDPDTGKLDFETLDKSQSKFWVSLTPAQADEMLRNLRVLEGEYDNRIQRMVDAGRYAGSVTLTLAGATVGYYDLEDHKLVEAYIAQVTGVSIIAIQEYLDKTIPERNAARKGPEGELIGKALDKASRRNGILWKLRREFVRQAPSEWRQAMLDAGYSYQGKVAIEKSAFAKLRAGASLPQRDYKQLYRQILQPSIGQ